MTDSTVKSNQNWKNTLAGTIAGISSVIIGHPFDTIKVRVQTQIVTLPGQLPKYKGVLDCITKTIRYEGVRGFYKGLSPPLVFDAATNALIFGSYGYAAKYFQKKNGATEKLSLSQVFLSGCFVGVITSFLLTPVELVKSRLQIQEKTGLYKGPIDCFIKVIKTDGLKGIFNGISSTWTRDIGSFGVYFAVYEGIKRQSLLNEKVNQSLFQQTLIQLFAGGMSGVISWTSIYPIDVIKSRLQTQTDRRYKGIIDCGRKILREEGISTFYKGLSPTIIRAFPTNAAIFAIYEIVMKILH